MKDASKINFKAKAEGKINAPSVSQPSYDHVHDHGHEHDHVMHANNWHGKLGEEGYEPLSTREYIKYLLHKRRVRKVERHLTREQLRNPILFPPRGERIRSFAVISGGVVVDVMRVQDSFAEVLASGPEFVEVTNKTIPTPGTMFVDEKFVSWEDAAKHIRPTIKEVKQVESVEIPGFTSSIGGEND